MSVPKPERNESEMEFLHNAGNLVEFTIRRCKKIPKRHTFNLSNKVTDTVWLIYNKVKEGNSRFPSNQHEAQERRDCFILARASLYTLVGQIEIVNRFAPIDGETMKEWVAMIRKEINLVNGVIDADKRRYKHLPQ